MKPSNTRSLVGFSYTFFGPSAAEIVLLLPYAKVNNTQLLFLLSSMRSGLPPYENLSLFCLESASGLGKH